MGGRRGAASSDAPAREEADIFEVPAAVVCANCGDPECGGCAAGDPLDRSGVLTIIPWERGSGTVWQRLLATAEATTGSAGLFFAALSPGSILAPLSFALLAELLAVTSTALVLLPAMLMLVPGLWQILMTEPQWRRGVLFAVLFGDLAFSLLLVTIHVLHGSLLRRFSVGRSDPPMRERGVRFGLYACGWDLCSSPLGALLSLRGLLSGGTIGKRTLFFALTAPSRATDAFLSTQMQVDPSALRRIRNRAVRWSIAATVPPVILIICGMIALLFL